MKKIVSMFAVLSTVAFAVPSMASVVTFDAQPEVYFVPSVTDSGFNFQSIADGFGTNNHPLWPTNGTMHLMSWTNNSSTSGFVMTALDNSAFAVTSFLFGSGYVAGFDGVSSLMVTGTGGPSNFSYTFTSGVDYTDYQYSLISLPGLSATQLTFTATGLSNRANFDNIAFTTSGAVPEPATWGMLIMGMGLVGVTMRRRTGAIRLVKAA